MQIQILSDVHTEFFNNLDSLPKFEARAPYLALLGDIGVIGKLKQYESFLLSQAQQFEKVLVISGNHEYYTCTVKETLDAIQKNL